METSLNALTAAKAAAPTSTASPLMTAKGLQNVADAEQRAMTYVPHTLAFSILLPSLPSCASFAQIRPPAAAARAVRDSF